MIYVNGTSGLDTNDGFTPATAKLTITNAVGTVNTDGVVNIADGVYSGAGNIQITINKNMTIQGQSQTGTIINGSNTNWIFQVSYVQPSQTVTIQKLTFVNATNKWGSAIYNDYQSTLIVNDCTFTGNTDSAVANDGNLTANRCTFTDNIVGGSGGAIYQCDGTATITDCTFTHNMASNSGGAIYTDSDTTTTIKGCTFTGNAAEAGGAISNSEDVTVIGSTLIDNTASNRGGAFSNYYGNDFTLNFNRIFGNTVNGLPNDIYDDNQYSEDIHNALYNWWGSNAGPEAGRIVGELVEYDPWLVMRYSANPTVITQGSSSTLTADFRYDSDETFHDPANGHLPDGTPVTFTTNLGNVGSKSVTIYTINGIATATLRGNEAAGEALTSTTLDGETLYSTVTINAATVNSATGTQLTGKTVGMQTTGAPIAPLALAIFSVLGGLAATRKKQ